jgi:hypothetical protein
MNDREISNVPAFFRVVAAPQSYLNMLYLLLSFPLGTFYFVFLVTGLALGLGLIITWVGIPILAGVIALSYAFVAFERSIAIAMLKVEIGPMRTTRAPSDLWGKFRALLTNPVTWKGIGYLTLKFPLGVASFVVLVTLISLSLALLLAPFYYQLPDVQIGWPGGLEVDTLSEALVASVVGTALGLVSMHALNGLALLWGWLARALLGRMGADAVVGEQAAASERSVVDGRSGANGRT